MGGWRQYTPKHITAPVSSTPLFILAGLIFVDYLDRAAFNVLTPEIKKAFHLSLSGLGALVAFLSVVSLIIELPIGYFADRKNRMKMASIGGVAWAVFSCLTGFAATILSLPLLYVARAGSVLGRAFDATHNSLIADFYPAETRARAYYTHRLAGPIGLFFGSLLAGGLAAVFGFRAPFYVLALPTFVFVYLALTKVKDPKRGVWERRAAGADEATAQTEEEAASFGETFRTLFANRTSKRIYVSLPFLSASTIGLGTFLQVFYDQVYHVGPGLRGVIGAVAEPSAVVGIIVGLVIVQKLQARDPGLVMKLLGVTAVGSAICFAVIALSPNVWVAVAANIVYAAINGLLTPAIFSVISLAVPPRMRALGFATGSLFLLLGAPIIPIVGGIGDKLGIRYGILVFIPVYLLGSFLLASSGGTINEDIAKVQASSLTQAEARRRRLEGDPQMLIIRGLNAGYDQTQILFDVDFEVRDGEIIALLGTNGAGKSTLLKAISGIVQPSAGAIIFDGIDVTNADAIRTAHLGVAQVPGGRGIFPSLTVAENLRAAGWMFRKDRAYLDDATARVLEHFPILEKRRDTAAGSLSGGEQQMLSLAQAFIARPKLLMIDELSLGLAPTIVERLLDIVRAIHDQGTTIILVEQSVNVALRLAKRAVFMEKGEIRFSGATEELLHRPDILRSVFLEGAQAGLAIGDGTKTTTRITAEDRLADSERRRVLLQKRVVLETLDVTKRYGGVTAVRDVNFQLHEGQILGLIGPNGAGKTTIFDLISGFTPLDGGRVLLEGKDVTAWPPHRRAAAGLGRSFQDARLWPALTVREALAAAMTAHVEVTNPFAAAFALPSVADSEARIAKKVEDLIGLLGLGAFRDKFIAELSTGSRRMVEIATLIANGPRIIILDEPSSGIAQKETEALGPMLKEVQRYTDCSILVIEHDMPLLNGLADHVVALELGSVIAFGTPDEVLKHPQVVESYLGTASYAELEREVEQAAGDPTLEPASPIPTNGANGRTRRRRGSPVDR